MVEHLKYLIETKGSAVICVAEGAGQVRALFKLLVLELHHFISC